MQDNAFISYKVDISKINENIDEFYELNLKEKKRFLLEILDKNMLYVNLSEIEDQDFTVNELDKKLNDEFYSLNKDNIMRSLF